MNQKFIIMWFLMVLCTAEPEVIKPTLSEALMPMKIAAELTPKKTDIGNIDGIMCPESHPIYCTEKNTSKKTSRCLAEKYSQSWNKDTRKEFIIDNNLLFSGDKVVTCQLTKNLLDFTGNEWTFIGHFGNKMSSKNPHDKVDDMIQCILIGHQHGSFEEILYYNVHQYTNVNNCAKGIQNKTRFQKFDHPGQIHYDFFSCSTTKEGIMNAKEWYDNQKPWYQIWNEKVKQWYGNYRNTYKFWVVILVCIVVLFGGICLCVYCCCGNYHAKQTEEGDTELVVNDSCVHSVSSSDFVIELSELLRMQTSNTDEYSVETMNSITSTTDPKQSHSTEDLSFLFEVELTKEMQDSEDSHHSQSETKEEESDDMHRSQSKNKVQKPEKKYQSNSEFDFSI